MFLKASEMYKIAKGNLGIRLDNEAEKGNFCLVVPDLPNKMRQELEKDGYTISMNADCQLVIQCFDNKDKEVK